MPKNTPGIAKRAIGMLIKRHGYARKRYGQLVELCESTRPYMLQKRGCKNEPGIVSGKLRRPKAGIQEKSSKTFAMNSFEENMLDIFGIPIVIFKL